MCPNPAFRPFAPLRASQTSCTKRQLSHTIFGKLSRVALLVTLSKATPFNCFAIFLGRESRASAHDSSGVLLGVENLSDEFAGDKAIGSNFDMEAQGEISQPQQSGNAWYCHVLILLTVSGPQELHSNAARGALRRIKAT
ncbi:hypothetical protein PT974_10218 [Cladobotryum mycophilum]|uniref:Uncharacterized protein n=1 Tax=Cladobotryum mycophilum TaxID=491253 RepID=A0ABR0S9R4_9HYPO